MKNINVLTFGSCGWDKIFAQKSDGRLELIYEEEGRKNSHQAVAALRAGAKKSTLVSFVGDDEIGFKVLKSLKNCGLETKYIKIVSGGGTEINEQYLDEITKDYTLKRGPSELSQYYTVQMVKEYENEINEADIVIMVSKQPKEFLIELINTCYKKNKLTALTISHKKFDVLNQEDVEVLRKVSFIAGNFEEACILTGKNDINDCLKMFPNMLITKGGDGVFYCDEKGKVCHEPAVKAQNVVETNGAGDTFIGNFVVFKAEGADIKECVRKAMCASTLEIQKMGVLGAMPIRTETEKLYNLNFNK